MQKSGFLWNTALYWKDFPLPATLHLSLIHIFLTFSSMRHKHIDHTLHIAGHWHFFPVCQHKISGTVNITHTIIPHIFLLFHIHHIASVSYTHLPVGPHGIALGTEETQGIDQKYLAPYCESWMGLAIRWISEQL